MKNYYIPSFEQFINEGYLFEAKDPEKSPIKTKKTKQAVAYYAWSGSRNLPGSGNVKQVAEILDVDPSEIFYNNLSSFTMIEIAKVLVDKASFTKAPGMKKHTDTAEYTYKKGKYKDIEFVAMFSQYDDDDKPEIDFIWMSRDAAEKIAEEFNYLNKE